MLTGQLRKRMIHRGRVARLLAIAALSAVSLMTFSTDGWAVDGGYGPVGGDGGDSGGGTFGDIIVAATVGPNGATIHGQFDGTTISIVIPNGEFATDQEVEVATFVPDCSSLKDGDTVVALAVSSTDGEHVKSSLSGNADAVVSSTRITPGSLVLSVDGGTCTILHPLVGNGVLTVPLQTNSAFVVTSPEHPNPSRREVLHRRDVKVQVGRACQGTCHFGSFGNRLIELTGLL